MTEDMNDDYDVLVIGGGAAGLNGALMLARARRSVLVIDAGAPRNAPAAGVHGLLGREGMAPQELLARGRAEVRQYGGRVVSGEVIDAVREADGFTVTLADGRSVRARRLLVTTGLVDELPSIPGLRERWGRDLVHCPYCHGWEIRDQAIGIVATGPMSVHQALLFRQWSPDIILFTHDTAAPTDEEAEKLAARGITVVTTAVAAIEADQDRLTGVRLDDGTVVPRQAVAVATHMVARAEFLAGLGLRTAEHPFGQYIPSDANGRTEVPGVWVAGNITDLAAQVGPAAAGGATAAAYLNAELVAEDTDRAVEVLRANTVADRIRAGEADGDPFSAAIESRIGELVMGERRHGL